MGGMDGHGYEHWQRCWDGIADDCGQSPSSIPTNRQQSLGCTNYDVRDASISDVVQGVDAIAEDHDIDS